jgi:uncharacterized protein YggE
MRWILNWFSALAVSHGLLSSFGSITRGDDEPLKIHTISVSATGKVSVRPDIAEITAGVMTTAPTAKDALAANNELMNKLLQALKGLSVADKDLQTSHVQVTPQYSQPQPRPVNTINSPPVEGADPAPEFIPRVVGYRVDNSVRIVARQIDKLGPMLDAIVAAGANQIFGISFRVENSDRLLNEARRRAMAESKNKAATLAAEAGVVLGLPLKIEEHDGSAPPGPIRYFGAAPMAPAAGISMPIAAGEQELAVTVSVIYELKHPH